MPSCSRRSFFPRLWFPRLIVSGLLLFLSFQLAYAQSGIDNTGTGGRHTIQGRIYFPSGRSADVRLRVRLEGSNTGSLFVMVDSNGHFTFRGLSPGRYEVIVEGGDEYETAGDSVYIDTEPRTRRSSMPTVPRAYSVTFHLRPKLTAGAGKAGVVNAKLATIPASARDLYNKALDAARAGDAPRAVDLLKAALSHFPDFALALNELGVQYLILGQPGNAIEALRAAVKLEPEAVTVRLNYGVALLNMRQFTEAELQLREALARNPAAATAHMYLGITLVNQRRYDEAEKSLLEAISKGGHNISQAHYYLGGIYWHKKEYKRAADELETYLKLAPKAPDAERIRATIRDLRSKPA